MPTYTIPTDNVTPRLIVVDDADSCTLTRASIRAFTRQDFEDQANKEVGMDMIIGSTKEARIAGVRESSLVDLLLSKHVAMGEKKGSRQGSIIAPFSLVPRQNIVNANYFNLEAGSASPGAGTGSMPASAWRVTANIGSSPWVASPSSGLKNLERYFLPGSYVIVEYKDAATQVLRSAQFKVVQAVNADAGLVSKAYVDLEPIKTPTGWAALSAGAKAVYQPTEGVVSLLGNSVSDYESWGHQFPGHLNRTLIEYWEQTIRWAHSFSSEYLKALESPLTSQFFKKFRTMPLAQVRKQQEMINQAQMLNTFFYGQEINENQTVERYTYLPQVMDPADPTCQIEFKSNTLGVRTQLDRAGRVVDKQGAVLDLDWIMENSYNLKRNRETTSGSIDRIDIMTDRLTAARIRDIMIKYYKSKYSTDLVGYFQPGQKVLNVLTKATELEYNLYDLPDQGLQMAIFTDQYFDDRLSAFSTAQKSRGRALWMIDWSDVAINVLATNSAKRTTNTADELYRYVITPVIHQTMLNSKTIEVGDTNRSTLIENFSDGCPNLTVGGCDLAG